MAMNISNKGLITITGDKEEIYNSKNKSLEYGLGVYAAYTVLLPQVDFQLKFKEKLIKNPLDRMILFSMTITNNNYNGYLPPPGLYNWWIYFNQTNDCSKKIYNIVEFSHMDFIIGFIHTFELYKVDFRDYTAWAPYTTDKKNKLVHINIDGYDMSYFDTKKIIQYGVIPYSS